MGRPLYVITRPSPPDTPTIANAVGDLYVTLAESEARLWQASQLTVSLVHANANVLVGLLDHPHQRNTIIADVMACAQAGQARLQCLTNLQAQTMLSMPAVALAYNVAMDCEAEFDNEEGLARWSKKARDLDCGNGNSER